MKMSWSKLAKARMKALGVSQETLSEQLGVTQGAVGHWLNHRRKVGIEEIIKILNVLGVKNIRIVDSYGMLDVNEEDLAPGPQSTVSDRLLFILSQLELSQSEFAKHVGVSPQVVNNWIKRNAFSKEMLKTISKVTGFSQEWLESGNGSLRREQETVEDNDSAIPPESEWGSVESWDRNTPLPTDEVEVPFLKDIEFACGDGRIMDEDHNGFKLRFSKATLRRVGANSDGSGILCFPAKGNSMEPLIQDGSTVAINTLDKKIVDGKVYAINQDGWKRLKILYQTGPNKVSIRSFNSEEHPPEEANLADVEVIGRLFWNANIW